MPFGEENNDVVFLCEVWRDENGDMLVALCRTEG